MSTQILPIPREMIPAMWPHVSGFLFIGMTVVNDVTMSDLVDDLVEGTDTLWTVIEDGKVTAAFVSSTFIDEDEGVRFTGVYALGGDGLMRWGKLLGETMAAHAKQTGTQAVRFSGRDAWSRVLPTYRLKGRRPGGEAIFERAVA